MENKNGQGIFYGVIGVATLIVAIIGATFAYFSASATVNGDNITGSTLELAGALTVNVEKLTFSGASAGSNNLVPATITVSTTGVGNALTANCEKNGYTGCHVYKITAESSETVSAASINLATLAYTGSHTTNKTDWKYIIYQGTDSTCSSLVTGGNGSMDLASPFDMHAGAGLTANTPVVYYLMVYLAEDNAQTAQNDGDTNDATGGYTGTITMTAGTGSVTANFTA